METYTRVGIWFRKTSRTLLTIIFCVLLFAYEELRVWYFIDLFQLSTTTVLNFNSFDFLCACLVRLNCFIKQSWWWDITCRKLICKLSSLPTDASGILWHIIIVDCWRSTQIISLKPVHSTSIEKIKQLGPFSIISMRLRNSFVTRQLT